MKNIAFLILISLGIFVCFPSQTQEAESSLSAKFRSEFILPLLENAKLKNENIRDRALYEIKHICSQNHFIKRKISQTASELSTVRQATRLCYLLAWDQVNGTSEVTKHLEKALNRHIIPSCKKKERQVRRVLQKLHDDLGANSKFFQTRITLAMSHKSISHIFAPMTYRNVRVEIKNFGVHSASCSFSLGKFFYDAYNIRYALKRTSKKAAQKTLGQIAQAAAKRALAPLPFMAVDGPLPVADAIVLGLEGANAVWSGINVYIAKKALKKEIQNNLERSATNHSNELERLAKKKVAELLENHTRFCQKLADNF